jgi:hypothetical protein
MAEILCDCLCDLVSVLSQQIPDRIQGKRISDYPSVSQSVIAIPK